MPNFHSASYRLEGQGASGIFHNHVVEPIGGCSVSRYCRDNRRNVDIPSHKVVQEYARSYGGVNRKDHDTSDWTTSIRTKQFYLRIFFWLLDATIDCMYGIACNF